MKNFAIIISLLLVIPLSSFSQDSDMKKLFNKYKNVSGFELDIEDSNINIDLDEDFDLANFLDKLNSVYVLDFEEHEGDAEDLASFKNKLNKLLDKKDFKAMVDIKGEESFAMLLRKNANDKTTDVLMISEEEGESSFIWASAE